MSKQPRRLLRSSRFARCFRRTEPVYQRDTSRDLDRDQEAVRTKLTQLATCHGRNGAREWNEDQGSVMRSAGTMSTFRGVARDHLASVLSSSGIKERKA